MRLLIAAAALAVSATAAHAIDAKTAPATDGNVVEFDVLAITAPPSLPGFCAVTGVAGKVWQGSTYRSGQPLFLSVPCAQYGLIPANARTDGIMPVNIRSLEQSKHGIARLSDQGELLWQDGGRKSFGGWGQVAGYRVLDARMLPATPS
jgi:hypothetical protein